MMTTSSEGAAAAQPAHVKITMSLPLG